MMVLTPIGNRYGVDVAQWGVDPNKEYIAYAIAQNINGEWVRCPSSSLPPVLPRWLLPRRSLLPSA